MPLKLPKSPWRERAFRNHDEIIQRLENYRFLDCLVIEDFGPLKSEKHPITVKAGQVAAVVVVVDVVIVVAVVVAVVVANGIFYLVVVLWT